MENWITALFLPGLGVAIRRLHDIGKSGWWYLSACAPDKLCSSGKERTDDNRGSCSFDMERCVSHCDIDKFYTANYFCKRLLLMNCN